MIKSYCLEELLVKPQSGPMLSCCCECFPPKSASGIRWGKQCSHCRALVGRKSVMVRAVKAWQGTSRGVKTAGWKKRLEKGWAGSLPAQPGDSCELPQGRDTSKGAWTGFGRGCFRKSADSQPERLSGALSLPGHRASWWHL